MIISARPYPNVKGLTSQGTHDSLSFFPLGRNALLSGLITLDLKKGDSVIVPAYMCNSTIEPLKAYGFNLIFIDIEKDLRLSIDKLKKAIEDNKIKALLVVHYFGLTQNFDQVIDMCQKYDIKVVEDASHSFLSQFLRNNDDIKSDAEIFSMRKSLAVVDGGALRINNDHYQLSIVSNSQCVSKISDVKYLMLRLLEKVVTIFGINIYGKFINTIKAKLRSNNGNKTYNFNTEPCQASWQLRRCLDNGKYLQNTQQRIVKNFNQLSLALSQLGFRLLVESVDENVVPQACVIYDDQGGLVDYLRSKGIGAWRWPDEEIPNEVVQNTDKYPNTIYFDEKLVLLPIHQSLGDKQINYIIQVLSKWQL